MKNKSKKSISEQIREERERLFGGKVDLPLVGLSKPLHPVLLIHGDKIIYRFLRGTKLIELTTQFHLSYTTMREYLVQKLGYEWYKKVLKQGTQATKRTDTPSIPILSTTTEEVQMPDVSETAPDSMPEPKLEEQNNKFINELFISHGDTILADFVIGHAPLSVLVRKYGFEDGSVGLTTVDYKAYIISRIGQDKYDDVVRARQREHGAKIGKSKLGGRSRRVESAVSALQSEDEKPTTGKYTDGKLELVGLPATETFTSPKENPKISVEFPTGLPFTIPNFEQSDASAQEDASGTDTASPEEPEVVDSMVAAIRDFMFSTTMLDLAYFYPAIWEVLHKHIVRKIGRAEYDTAVINRLYTVTDELSRAQ